MKFQQRIQEKQKKVQELKQTVNTIKLSAQTAVDDSERIFTELISSMEKKRSEVTELIRAQEKAELSRAERLLEQLEQEIADLQRRVTELEQLSHTHDHIHFLQALASGRQSRLLDRPEFDTSSITVPQHLSFDGVRNSLSDLKKRLEEFCEEEFNKIPPHAAAVQIISPSEPQSREEFLKYFCYLTLDPNTTHRLLILSKKNRLVTGSVFKTEVIEEAFAGMFMDTPEDERTKLISCLGAFRQYWGSLPQDSHEQCVQWIVRFIHSQHSPRRISFLYDCLAMAVETSLLPPKY
ncbi:hypothetical protein KOW79_005798 [Hemibagrus wyckioides]|uniref:TRIM8/14/16/25/29/45/65 coiled-coil region domain-containing protein n=1 Tax=Hemibagrus wyckioides TaxID=337641 RepID=A0A9D3P142_9TELE|nr:hypothetical protein KOW79_005798 [Hemibagrus wyckioides]